MEELKKLVDSDYNRLYLNVLQLKELYNLLRTEDPGFALIFFENIPVASNFSYYYQIDTVNHDVYREFKGFYEVEYHHQNVKKPDTWWGWAKDTFWWSFGYDKNVDTGFMYNPMIDSKTKLVDLFKVHRLKKDCNVKLNYLLNRQLYDKLIELDKKKVPYRNPFKWLSN